jgi:hypothetical protein
MIITASCYAGLQVSICTGSFGQAEQSNVPTGRFAFHNLLILNCGDHYDQNPGRHRAHAPDCFHWHRPSANEPQRSWRRAGAEILSLGRDGAVTAGAPLRRSKVRIPSAPPCNYLILHDLQSLWISPTYPALAHSERRISPRETEIFGLWRSHPPAVSRRKIPFPRRVA